MALLDNVMKAVTGTPATADGSLASLGSVVLAMLSSKESGGITGLVQQFTAKGLGPIISSWIGTGQNLPISPEQLQNVFGSEQIKGLATKAGMTPDAAVTGLAQILPQLINGLTPKGEVPQGDLMSKGLELLKGKLVA